MLNNALEGGANKVFQDVPSSIKCQDILVYIFMSLYVPLPMNYSCSCLKMRLCWSQEVFAWFAIANRILSCEKSSFETTIVGMRHFWRLRWEAASAPLQFLSSSLGSCTNTYRICKKNTKYTQILIVNTKNHVENVKYILKLQQNKCKYSGNAKIVGNTTNTYW